MFEMMNNLFLDLQNSSITSEFETELLFYLIDIDNTGGGGGPQESCSAINNKSAGWAEHLFGLANILWCKFMTFEFGKK